MKPPTVKQNQRRGNKKQTDSDQSGGERGITGKRRGRVKEHVQKTHGQGQRGEGD